MVAVSAPAATLTANMPPKKRARSAVDSRAERAAGRAATATDYAVAEPDYEPAPSKVSLSARQVEIDAALKITANVSEMTLLEEEKLLGASCTGCCAAATIESTTRRR